MAVVRKERAVIRSGHAAWGCRTAGERQAAPLTEQRWKRLDRV